jgi:hypothetical protein
LNFGVTGIVNDFVDLATFDFEDFFICGDENDFNVNDFDCKLSFFDMLFDGNTNDDDVLIGDVLIGDSDLIFFFLNDFGVFFDFFDDDGIGVVYTFSSTLSLLSLLSLIVTLFN